MTWGQAINQTAPQPASKWPVVPVLVLSFLAPAVILAVAGTLYHFHEQAKINLEINHCGAPYYVNGE